MKKAFSLLASMLIGFAALTQNVGIGTTTPQSTLDVKGNHRMGGLNKYLSFDSATGKITWSNANLFVPSSQYLMQHSASGEGLFYGNSKLLYRGVSDTAFYTDWNTGYGYFRGNLGVGITNPAAKLHIYSGSSGSTQLLGPAIIESSGPAYLHVVNPNTSQSGVLFGTTLSNYAGMVYNNASLPTGLMLLTKNSARMVIDSIGNVGIGIPNPGFPLNFPTTLGDKISFFGNSGNHYGIGIQPSLLQIHAGQSIDDIAFGYGNSGAFVENMRIKGNGYVGIGTSDPITNLHIVSSNSFPFVVDGASSLFLSWAENGVYRGYLGSYAGNAEDIDFGTYSGNSTGKIHFTIEDVPKVTIVPSGNTGIGTTNPSEKLEVSGNIKADSIKASAFKYSSPKMLYYSIPDAAFTSTNSGYLVFKTGGTGGAYIANAPGVGQLVAPLHLPHGALLVSMTFDFYDASATQDITGQLILQSNGFITPYSSVQSSGSAGANSQTANYNVPINNQLFAYYVSVSASAGAWNNADIRIRRILVQYTLNETQ